MNLSGNARPARCGLVWAGASLATAAGLALLDLDVGTAGGVLADPAGVPFDRWLTALCQVAAAACALWGWLVTTVVVTQALAGRPRAQRTPGVPGWARRIVLVACGVAALGATAPAAQASSDDAGDGDSLADLLEGLPLPDRAEGPSVTESIGRTLARAVPQAGPVHEVRPGDSLWTISERALAAAGHHVDDAAVTAYWHRIHEHNRARIGADPDLIHPGQRLRLPPLGEEER